MNSPDPLEPAAFYTGLVAELYAPLRSVVADAAPYARFIERSGEPALELGCGDGDPLLALRALGLDVEGLDSSADMLLRCRAAAEARGLAVTLHHQSIESMQLARRYRSIFLAGPTFNLLVDDDTVRVALAAIREHLEPAGSVLIPLFIPEPTPARVLGVAREKLDGDGSTIRFTALSEQRDEGARLQTTLMRYEREAPGSHVVVDRPWLLHWHTQDGFRQLATEVGLRVAAVRSPLGKPATPDDQSFVFILAEFR